MEFLAGSLLELITQTSTNLPPDVRAGLQKQIEDKKRQQELVERLSKQAAKKK